MAHKATLDPYRPTKDGSYDPICQTCVAAVACSRAKADLPEKDMACVCNSAFLAERGCFNRAESMRTPVPSHPHNRIRPPA
jgi:hypothetical protein